MMIITGLLRIAWIQSKFSNIVSTPSCGEWVDGEPLLLAAFQLSGTVLGRRHQLFVLGVAHDVLVGGQRASLVLLGLVERGRARHGRQPVGLVPIGPARS